MFTRDTNGSISWLFIFFMELSMKTLIIGLCAMMTMGAYAVENDGFGMHRQPTIRIQQHSLAFDQMAKILDDEYATPEAAIAALQDITHLMNDAPFRLLTMYVKCAVKLAVYSQEPMTDDDIGELMNFVNLADDYGRRAEDGSGHLFKMTTANDIAFWGIAAHHKTGINLGNNLGTLKIELVENDMYKVSLQY